MKPHRRLALALALALALGSCGYFNSLYNARRQFAQAERLRESGNLASARQDYVGSIEKAAKSYRKYPAGRWADDALYLIGRSRFRLAEYPAAKAAFLELLHRTSDSQLRAGAHAFAGATEVHLGSLPLAIVHLDSALSVLGERAELSGFAHLWRARARAQQGDLSGAWRDLDAVVRRGDATYTAVQLERIVLAIAAGDTVHAASAIASIMSGPDARSELDTLGSLARKASVRFGSASVRAMLAQQQADWSATARDSLAFIRAQIAADAADTTNGHHELRQLSNRAAGPIAAAARVALARSRLRSESRVERLSDIRALLLPAISNPEAQVLIRDIRLVDVLVQRSFATGQPLGIFAAAEIARDELRAPVLARKLFLVFGDVGARTPWAAKSLLAAIAIAPDAADANAIRVRLAALPANPYTAITNGADASNYETAEERLARSLTAVRSEAMLLASQEEGAVTRAIAAFDSAAKSARTDTLRVACGLMIDTLAIVGVRADSVRTACMRSDTAKVVAYMKADTAIWLRGAMGDSAKTRVLKNTRHTNVRRDSTLIDQ